MSDDERRLSLMQSYAALTGKNDYLFLNTDSYINGPIITVS